LKQECRNTILFDTLFLYKHFNQPKAHSMRKLKFAEIYSIPFFLFLITSSISCVKSSNSGSSTPVPAFSYISVMNLAPYGDSAKVYFNGSVYPQTYHVGDFSVAYFKLSSSSYDVQFKTAASSDSLLADIPASSFDSLSFYTLLLYNDTINGPAKAAKIPDDYSAITTSTSGYRFFNMSPDISSVDLYINGVKVQSNRTPADNITNPLFNSFQPITNQYSTIEAKLTGTNTDVATSLNGNIMPGNGYTIFLEESHTSSGNLFALNLVKASY
jgi:hypothetical protein